MKQYLERQGCSFYITTLFGNTSKCLIKGMGRKCSPYAHTRLPRW